MNNNTKEVNTNGNNQEKANKALKRVIIALVILIVLLIAGGVYLFTVKDNITGNPYAIADTTEWDGENQQSGKSSEAYTDQIAIPGYAMIYVTEENRDVKLINPTNNTVFFKYDIKDEAGNTLLSTDLIPPGQMIKEDFYDIAQSGSATYVFSISTFDVDTYEQCLGTDLKVTITK